MDKKYLREKWAEAISSIEDFKRHLVEKRKAEKDPKKKEQLQKQIDDANDNIEKIKEKARNLSKKKTNESQIFEKYLR